MIILNIKKIFISLLKKNCKKLFGLRSWNNNAAELCIPLNINFNLYQNIYCLKNTLLKLI